MDNSSQNSNLSSNNEPKQEPAILNITNIDDYVKVLVNNTLVVVDFYTTWCGPCKTLSPYFHELFEEYGSQIQFCKVNCDEENTQAAEIFEKCKLEGFPTMLFYKNGQRSDILVGCSPDLLTRKCKELLE